VRSSETSFSAAIKKSNSSGVRVVLSVVQVALDFIQEEGFGGVIFIFMEGSSSSLGGVTLLLLCSTSVPPSLSPSPPCTGYIEVVFVDMLGTSSTSSSFLVLLGPGVSGIASELSSSDMSAGSTVRRRSADHSLVISSKSSSTSL
jgi:hypothetical protein